MAYSSYAHHPAARRLALEVAHEALAISQHPPLRPLAHGLSTVVTEVLATFHLLRHRVSFWDGVGLRVYVEGTPIDWPLTIELIRDAQAERGEWV